MGGYTPPRISHRKPGWHVETEKCSDRDSALEGVQLPIEIDVKKITHAENNDCHQKQSESLPIPYCPQSENLRHGNVPEKLKDQRHDENCSHDRESCEKGENQRHTSWRLDIAGPS
jgi:hypothetical protein